MTGNPLIHTRTAHARTHGYAWVGRYVHATVRAATVCLQRDALVGGDEAEAKPQVVRSVVRVAIELDLHT